ncbi:hypothetical protein ASZ90_015985 [hydrocarbon metagenome]|uniref:Uncharacterized protein n=1 Tax=hydrocarbon metagenome TaxID=938273 RepID=A0A0W8F0J0_9ZZZZ
MKLTNSIAPVFILAMLWASLIVIPAYHFRAEAGHSVIMSSGSVSSSTSDRFITSSDNPGVELNHNIRVTDTVGKVTVYMNILSMEGRGTDGQAYETVSFRESTTVQGLISLFDKSLRYESALTGDTF